MTREDLKPAFGPCYAGGSRGARFGAPAAPAGCNPAASASGSTPSCSTVSHDSAFHRLGLTLGALACLLLSGCGMSQLERHTTAAGILHAGTGIAASVVDHGAREAAASAGDEAELAEALRPWRIAEASQHLAAEAVDDYRDAVLAMAVEAMTGEPDDTRALRALRGAVSAYAALADLLATLGVDLPPVGRVLALVGGAL